MQSVGIADDKIHRGTMKETQISECLSARLYLVHFRLFDDHHKQHHGETVAYRNATLFTESPFLFVRLSG